MRAIVLDELQWDGRAVMCTPEEAALAASTGLVEMRPEYGGGFRALPTRNVGAVRVGDLQIEVRPKGRVGVKHLLFLLGYARDQGFRDSDVTAVADDELLPALAESLARHTARALAGGVHQGYVVRSESERAFKGRLRVGDQMTRHFGRAFPVEITYDDYSADVPENQILRGALRRVLEVPGLRQDVALELSRFDAWLSDVTVLPRGSTIPAWQPTRLNESYHPALRLSELILRHQSASASDGKAEVASFVVPMWKVFEDFVGIALAESLRRYRGIVEEQYPADLDVPPADVAATRMAVDVVHLVEGVPQFVADAKYKAASSTGEYTNADKYQMLAYCTALGVKRAWLVYAQGGEPVVRRVRNSNVEIVEWPLDLSLEPAALLQRVNQLADAMVSGQATALESA